MKIDMTNEEKAKELASSERISFDELNDSYCNGIECGALEMAEWKDEQFKEYLEKKRDKYQKYAMTRQKLFPGEILYTGKYEAVNEIINELFGDEEL